MGESWEISGVKDNESVVSNGEYKGWTLNKLVETLKDKLVGKENYERFGNEFPLLVKFIDAREQLSIQVHPTDEQAQAQGLGRGKTEMWYVMESDADASLRSGLKQQITPEQYKEMVEMIPLLRLCQNILLRRVTYSSCQQVVFTLSVQAVSWQRYRRQAM